MKTIGLVGGTSWVSTVEYYTYLNQMVNQRLGGEHSAKCMIYSVDFAELVANTNRGDQAANGEIILDAAKRLYGAGCELLMLCANTMHMYVPRIQSELSIEIVHIAEATGAEIKRRGLETVGLLGTRYVMNGDFYKGKLAATGLNVLTPNEEDGEYVHNAIFNELVKEQFKPETKKRFVEIMEEMRLRGSQGAILGCTEIPILVQPCDTDIPMFNTTRIHAAAAVERAIA